MSQPDAAADDPSPSPSPNPPPPPVAWPEDGALTREWVAGLTATLDWCSRSLPADRLPDVLPAALVQRLVLAASVILHREPNLVRVDPRPDQAVVVVGDVHGQLHDVIFLLRDAGFPSDDRVFVFNGDYVDRGAWGLETFLLLLAWKVLLPNSVFLLRGNHESKYCTSVYGFEQEVNFKYKGQGPQVYRKFLRCFEDLPLATIIAGCVYTAHGGIFRGTIVMPSKRTKKGKKGNKYKANSSVDPTLMKLGSLDELLKARRTVLDPPWEGSNLIPGDVLWSDPSLEMGLSSNKERGIGLLWGPDITQQFLYTNNLKLIIRSHEGPDARDKRHDLLGMDNGYTIDHHVECGKLITLFSAPDYPQFQASEDRYNNCGAYIVLNPPDFSTPVFHSFEAVKPRPKLYALPVASPSLTSLFSAAAAAGVRTLGSPASVRLCSHRQRRRRLVVAFVRWRYKGTARKEAALSELIERKVAEATEACAGEAAGEAGCRVAWDEVEEVSQAKAGLRHQIAQGADDPLEPFCFHNPLADDCAVVYDDDDDE
uniref:Serine/threonine-protein phosphatase n=1 Tax=Oryza nivara TaxID=4536 RepID=A0A0E0IEE4_ORYNI